MSLAALEAPITSIEIPLTALEEPMCSVPVNLLRDGLQTTIYVVRHERDKIRPKLVVFDQPTVLLDHCLANDINHAIVGGYDVRHSGTLMGDVFVDGIQQKAEPIPEPWDAIRGCAYIDNLGELALDARGKFPKNPKGDLLHAGPLIVKDGKPLIEEGVSPEGFSATAHQFTPDPTEGRHPRAAIGYGGRDILTVVSDGRRTGEAGLTLRETADVMIALGAKDVLILDGGSSAQLVYHGKILNKPRGQHGDKYDRGLPISTAIEFYRR
jgi:hypothetical protein